MTRDTLIEQNIDLVHSVVRGYLRQHPHLGYLKDDLLSAGQIGLCEAIDRIGTSKPENIKGFLAIAIRRSVKEAVVNEDSIKVPTRTRSRLRKQGKEVEVVSRVHQLDTIARTDPGMELVDVMDAIDAACESDFERQIVKLRIEGYTTREIGARLECDCATVCRALKAIYKRYKEVTS
jgi:RNA polymerase sigma factor (sigma-70 family)